MSKPKRVYHCQSCGGQFLQWSGQCGECQSWNSLLEDVALAPDPRASAQRMSGYAAVSEQKVTDLSAIRFSAVERFSSGIKELEIPALENQAYCYKVLPSWRNNRRCFILPARNHCNKWLYAPNV